MRLLVQTQLESQEEHSYKELSSRESALLGRPQGLETHLGQAMKKPYLLCVQNTRRLVH